MTTLSSEHQQSTKSTQKPLHIGVALILTFRQQQKVTAASQLNSNRTLVNLDRAGVAAAAAQFVSGFFSVVKRERG